MYLKYSPRTIVPFTVLSLRENTAHAVVTIATTAVLVVFIGKFDETISFILSTSYVFEITDTYNSCVWSKFQVLVKVING